MLTKRITVFSSLNSIAFVLCIKLMRLTIGVKIFVAFRARKTIERNSQVFSGSKLQTSKCNSSRRTLTSTFQHV